jgi:hypothetical protein
MTRDGPMRRGLTQLVCTVIIALVVAGCGSAVATKTSSHTSAGVGTQAAHSTSSTTIPKTTTTTPSFAAFAGTWGLHDTAGLRVDASGRGSVGLPDFAACSTCSEASVPINTITFTLTSIEGVNAVGLVTAVSDPNDPIPNTSVPAAVGDPVELIPTSGSPGQLLDIEINGSSVGSFCDATAGAAGECGA